MAALTIGRLADAAGVNVETVRYYERRGLLVPPPRTASGYRQYGEADVWRLDFIGRAKEPSDRPSTLLSTDGAPPADLVAVLTSATFDDVVATATTPVLVDFTATWCPPCQVLKPVLRQVAAEQTGRLAIVEVDIDAHPDLAVRYSVMSAPTMVLLVDGQPVRTLVGSRGRARLLEDLAPHLG